MKKIALSFEIDVIDRHSNRWMGVELPLPRDHPDHHDTVVYAYYESPAELLYRVATDYTNGAITLKQASDQLMKLEGDHCIADKVFEQFTNYRPQQRISFPGHLKAIASGKFQFVADSSDELRFAFQHLRLPMWAWKQIGVITNGIAFVVVLAPGYTPRDLQCWLHGEEVQLRDEVGHPLDWQFGPITPALMPAWARHKSVKVNELLTIVEITLDDQHAADEFVAYLEQCLEQHTLADYGGTCHMRPLELLDMKLGIVPAEGKARELSLVTLVED